MKLRRAYSQAAPFDLTPLVDVVFLLLIFFLLSSPFVSQAGVHVTPPEIGSAELLEGQGIEVSIGPDDRVYLAGREVAPEELRKELEEAARRGERIFITGDEKATLGRTFQVWDACRAAGVRAYDMRMRMKPARAEERK